MPTYDYQCENGHHFELFQKMTEPKLDTCPQCGGRVERLIGPGAGLVFKGSGFYSTDYRSEKYKRAAKAETGSGSDKTATTPGGKSEPATGNAAKDKDKAKDKAKDKDKAPTKSPEPKPAAGGNAGPSSGGSSTAKD